MRSNNNGASRSERSRGGCEEPRLFHHCGLMSKSADLLNPWKRETVFRENGRGNWKKLIGQLLGALAQWWPRSSRNISIKSQLSWGKFLEEGCELVRCWYWSIGWTEEASIVGRRNNGCSTSPWEVARQQPPPPPVAQRCQAQYRAGRSSCLLEPLLSWAAEIHTSMGGPSSHWLRLRGRIEVNVDSLVAQRERLIRKNRTLQISPWSDNGKGSEFQEGEGAPVSSPSLPLGPIAAKRQRCRDLIAHDDERRGCGGESGYGGGDGWGNSMRSSLCSPARGD